jgi:hypothetical protein
LSRNINDPVGKAIQRFIVLPIILVFGIYLVGAFVEAFFKIPAAAVYIFSGVGGVAFLVYYYREWIKKIMMR